MSPLYDGPDGSLVTGPARLAFIKTQKALRSRNLHSYRTLSRAEITGQGPIRISLVQNSAQETQALQYT